MKTLILVLLLISPAVAQNDAFISIFETQNVIEKKEIWHTLTKDEKDEVRRLNYAWGIKSLELDKAQTEYLERLSKSLPTITQDEVKDFEKEAIDLFTHKDGLLLFGSIGPYKPCDGILFIQQSLPAGNCNCNMTTWNTCSGSCGPTVCRWTEDGCGFGWLQRCTSICIYE